MRCLVCEKYYHYNDNWYGWWGEGQMIRNPDGVLVLRGIYCKPCFPAWAKKLVEDY